MTGYDSCVRCGLCLPACPTYLETMTETSGPRGRISLIKAVDQGALDLLSPGFVEQMSQCLDCRACQAVCPSGVPYGPMLEEMRARIEAAQAPSRPAHARTMRYILLQWLFAKPSRMRAAASLLRFSQHSGLTALANLVGLRETVRLAPQIPDRYFIAEDQRYDVDLSDLWKQLGIERDDGTIRFVDDAPLAQTRVAITYGTTTPGTKAVSAISVIAGDTAMNFPPK